MSEEIIKVLDDLSERLGVAIDWSAENVLPYAQELFQKFVSYEIWTSALYVVIVLIIILLGFWVTKKWFEVSEGCVLFFTVPTWIVAIIIGIPEIIDIITALTFPEKLLFDYIQHMQ